MVDNSFGYGSWKITEEQAEQIKTNCIEAMTLFMSENDTLIKFYARKYYSSKCSSSVLYSVEDMISTLFLDLPYLDYSNAGMIKNSVYRSFYYSAYGGIGFLKQNHRAGFEANNYSSSYCTPLYLIDDDGDLYCVADKYTGLSEEESLSFLYESLSVSDIKEFFKPLMSPRVYEFFENAMDGYGTRENLRKLGLKVSATGYLTRTREAVALNYDKFLDFLSAHSSDYLEHFRELATTFVPEVLERKKRHNLASANRNREVRARKKAQAV